jgi:hypothetical protein
MAEMTRQLTQAEINRILFNQSMGLDPRGQVPMPSIQNLQQRTSGNIAPVSPNIAQLAAGGANRVGQFLNQILPNAQQVVELNPLNLERLFPTVNAQPQVTIPTGFNFAPKQAPTGEVIPGGLQSQQVNLNQLLSAIKPADVLGVSGAERAYTDVGMGKAPNTMDVIDTLALGAGGMAAGKNILGAVNKIPKISGMEFNIKDSIPSLLGKEAKNESNWKITEDGGFYTVSPKKFGESGTVNGEAQGFGLYPGTASETRGFGQSVYGVTEQEANGQVLNRLKNVDQNPLFNVANKYTNTNLSKAYDFNFQLPESSLAKQSGIGRSYEIMTGASKPQKDAVFAAYVNDPEFAPIIQQYNIKDYDDLVQKSYQQLEKETMQQFNNLPLKLQFHTGQGNYLDSSEAVRDMILHGNLTVYKGGDRHDFLNNIDKNTGLNSNEMFRAVHDAFGHGIRGNGFGPVGEEVAWGSHAQMYSPLARIAMTSETRGQNSFVNYTPINAELVSKMESLRAIQYEAKRKGDVALVNEISSALRELGNDWQYAKQASVALPPEFTRMDFVGGMPDYLRTTQNVPLPTDPQALTHFGKVGGLLELSPKQYGSGIVGQEAERLKYSKNPVRDRTYFYRGEPGQVTPEVGLGPNVYTAQLPNMYDITADPLGFNKLANIRNTTSYLAKYGQGRVNREQSLTDLERLVKEYGYKGLLDPTKGIVFDPVPVRQVR